MHRRRSAFLACVCMCAWAAPSPAVAAELPRVRVVATGGTISNRTGGRLTADDLIRTIPELERYARVEGEQFSNVASTAVTLEQWLQLARRINEIFENDPGLAGIVVTHGTDTLEETAFFLHLTVRHARPVVMVGAMRNASTLGYEGPANLLAGIRVAADPEARDKGVLVVLNDEINSAREVTKTDSLRLHTFQTRGYGVLGVVDADRVVFSRHPIKRHTSHSEFDASSIATLPRVDIFPAYQGAPGDLIRAAVDNGAAGVVLAGAGEGGASGAQVQAMRYAAGKGVLMVIGTRAGAGRVSAPRGRPQASADGEENRWRAMSIAAEDHAPLKARILLMLALTKTKDPSEIQRMFREY